jgi:hypothetical protein
VSWAPVDLPLSAASPAGVFDVGGELAEWAAPDKLYAGSPTSAGGSPGASGVAGRQLLERSGAGHRTPWRTDPV